MSSPRRSTSKDDHVSAISPGTPITSNSSGRKRRPRPNNRNREIDDDFSAVSTATPIVSNKSTPDDANNSQLKSDQTDYGQLVIDARSQDPKRRNALLKDGKPSSTNTSKRLSRRSKNALNSPDRDGNSGGHGSTNDKKSINSLNVQSSSQCESLIDVAGQESQNDTRQKNTRGRALETSWLPFFVVTLSTVRFLLSTTSSLGCNFIEIDIGFVPKNIKIATSTVKIGPWAYERGKCLSYPHNFSKIFIQNERAWEAARMASIVNITLGFIVFITASCVITYKVLRLWPTSARATSCIKGVDKRWEVCIFVLVLLMFIFEVIKFSLWGVNLCTDDVWMTKEFSFFPAKECSLSTGAKCSLGAIVIDIIVVMLLSVWSRNLRWSFSRIFCFWKRFRRNRELVRTEDDEENLAEPRYFFEGNENNEQDESKYTEDADVTKFHKRSKSNVKDSAEDNELDASIPINNKPREGSSLHLQSDHSISLEQTEKKWLNMKGQPEDKAKNACARAVSSESGSGDEPSSRNSTEIASEKRRYPFEDDTTADLLVFNKGPLTLQQLDQ